MVYYMLLRNEMMDSTLAIRTICGATRSYRNLIKISGYTAIQIDIDNTTVEALCQEKYK